MRVVFVTSTLSESHLLLHDDATLTSLLFRKMILLLLDDRCEIKAESVADDWHDDMAAP